MPTPPSRRRSADDPFDRLEAAAEKVANRVIWENGNRIGLLWVHAIIAAVVGLQILVYGGPSNIEDSVGVWTRTALGCAAATGGLTLALGLTRRPRSIPIEAVGLAIIGVWDLAMTLGLAWARFSQGTFAPVALTHALSPSYVRPYPVTMYAGWFVLVAIHLLTLRRMVKERKS